MATDSKGFYSLSDIPKISPGKKLKSELKNNCVDRRDNSMNKRKKWKTPSSTVWDTKKITKDCQKASSWTYALFLKENKWLDKFTGNEIEQKMNFFTKRAPKLLRYQKLSTELFVKNVNLSLMLSGETDRQRSLVKKSIGIEVTMKMMVFQPQK